MALDVDGIVHDHSCIIRLCLLLLVHPTRLYYCAPLLVGLALEDGERGALGIAKDGDLADELEIGRLHVRELVVEREQRPVVEQEQTPPPQASE